MHIGYHSFQDFAGVTVTGVYTDSGFAVANVLERGGRLVIPIGPPQQQFLRVYVATPEGPADFAAVPCRFVPLVSSS